MALQAGHSRAAGATAAAERPPTAVAAFRTSFTQRLLLAAGLLVALAATLAGIDLWQTRQLHLDLATRRAASVALAAEHRVMKTLGLADQTIRMLRSDILEMRARNDMGALQQRLARLAPDPEEILTVMYVGPDGTGLARSNPALPAHADFGNRDFFRHHALAGDPRADTLYVERPRTDPETGTRTFTVSRALRGATGELLGVIAASIRPESLADEFGMLRLGTLGAVGLHHLDSYTVIARQPDYTTTFGETLAGSGLREALASSPEGTFEGVIANDNETRLFSYRKLESLPLAITAGIARADILAAVARNARRDLAALLLLLLAAAGGTLALLRSHRRELALEAALAEKEILFRNFFTSAPVAMCLLDRDMRHRLANCRYGDICATSAAALVGKPLREVSATLFEQLSSMHGKVLDGCGAIENLPLGDEAGDQPEGRGHWVASLFPIPDTQGIIDAVGLILVDVSAQKQTEIALRRSERLLSSVLDALPVGVWITDRSGRIVLANPAGERIWAGKRMVGPEDYGEYKGWWVDSGEPIAADDWAAARAIRNGEDSIGELVEIACFDGSHRVIINSAIVLRDAEGQVAGAIIVNEDITEMRQAEEATRIARDFFENAFNAAPVGMAIAGVDGRYTKVNRAMTELLGYSEAELLTMTFSDLTHPDDLARNVDLRDRMLAGEIPSFRMDKRYVRRDGGSFWALLVVSLIRDGAGRPGHTIAQMLDIDQQKRAGQALRESEARFRAIFDNANTAIAAADARGFLTDFNEAFRELLGYDVATLREKHFAEFTHPDDLPREQLLLAELAAGDRQNYRLEKRYQRADGQIVWIDISVAAVRDTAGRVLNFVAVIRDITESKHAEQALTESRQKLRALSAHQALMLEEDRKHIAREIHDELGQLLTTLKMELSLLRMRSADPDSVAGMSKLVDRTIDVVRQVATNLRPAALDFGLLPAIEWLAKDFAARWGIACTATTDGSDIRVGEDLSTTVFRVVQESLTNVARHANATRVSITLRRTPHLLQLTVQDNGCGFDAALTRKKAGFGLFGMRERVLAAGGHLSIESAPGEGTTVIINLPLDRERSS